ncbi:MAG: hypothetical protein G5Z42_05960 [Caldisphaeraceae archaeon]|nr:hypothetical protein [Caldisphaeraceae archaeon]MEB3692528.1 hypothetical protein [Caldisphaeraceae archaeon]MEB3798342.1 hypothetical protein [Caldisphaeraceae archaeon]
MCKEVAGFKVTSGANNFEVFVKKGLNNRCIKVLGSLDPSTMANKALKVKPRLIKSPQAHRWDPGAESR